MIHVGKLELAFTPLRESSSTCSSDRPESSIISSTPYLSCHSYLPLTSGTKKYYAGQDDQLKLDSITADTKKAYYVKPSDNEHSAEDEQNQWANVFRNPR